MKTINDNSEKESRKFSLKLRLKYILYKDEQLEIMQEGINSYFWIIFVLFMIIYFSIDLMKRFSVMSEPFFSGILSTSEGILTLSLSILVFLLFLLEFIVIFRFLRFRVFQGKDLKIPVNSLCIQTNESASHLSNSISIKLDSYSINIPFTNKNERYYNGLYRYYCYNQGLSLPLNKQLKLIIGSKTVSFSLSLTDPRNIQPPQDLHTIVFYIKDLTILKEVAQLN